MGVWVFGCLGVCVFGCVGVLWSRRKRQAKSWEGTERPAVESTLAKTSDDGFQISLQPDLLQLMAVYRDRRVVSRQNLKRPVFVM